MTLEAGDKNDKNYVDIFNIPTQHIHEMKETWERIQTVMKKNESRLKASKTHNRTTSIRKAMTPSLTITEGDSVGEENTYGLAPFGIDETSGLVTHPIHSPHILEGNLAWNKIDNIARALGETRLPKNSKTTSNIYKDIAKLRFNFNKCKF